MENTSGTAVTTVFRGQMVAWADDDLPLSYEFRYATKDSTSASVLSVIDGEAVNEFLMIPQGSTASFTANLPGGDVYIIGYCIDALGGRSQSVVKLTVLQNTELIKIKESADIISTLDVDYASAVRNMSKVSAIALTLDQNFSSSETATIYSINQKLISVIKASKQQADKYKAEGSLIEAAYVYAAVVQTIGPMGGVKLSFENLSQLMGAYEGILAKDLMVGERLQISGGQISATSVQTVFGTIDLMNFSQGVAQGLGKLSMKERISEFWTQYRQLVRLSISLSQANYQPTEISRVVKNSTIQMKSTKKPISQLKGTALELDTGSKVTFPEEWLSGSQDVEVSALYTETNPYEQSDIVTLDSYFTIDITDAQTQSEVPVQNLTEPIVITFKVGNATLEKAFTSLSTQFKLLSTSIPQCRFWTGTEWSTEGCSLLNLDEVNVYFEQGQPIVEPIDLNCGCLHLSDFTIAFSPVLSFQANSYIIREDDDTDFDWEEWNTYLPILLLFCTIGFCLPLMLLSVLHDLTDKNTKKTSIGAPKAYNFFDIDKIHWILESLQRDFIVSKINERARSTKESTKAYISKILKSKLLGHLIKETTPDDTFGHMGIMYQDSIQAMEDETSYGITFEPQIGIPNTNSAIGWKKDDLLNRIRTYIKHDQPIPTTGPVPTDRLTQLDGTPVFDYEEISATKAMYNDYLNSLNSYSELYSPVDDFIEKYDNTEKLTKGQKEKLKIDDRMLTESKLNKLGYQVTDFAAIRANADEQICIEPKLLTGGAYARSLIENMEYYVYKLKISYRGLVMLFIKKEHKLFCILFKLHIEYEKMHLTLALLVFLLQQLLYIHLYVLFFNFKFSRTFNERDGLCVWGCNYEAQIFAGIVCSIMPWPLYHIMKCLYAKNLIPYIADSYQKQLICRAQAYQNKQCRKIIGHCLFVTVLCVVSATIITLALKMPMGVGRAEDFLIIWIAGLIYTFIIAEFAASLFKALIIWTATYDKINKFGGNTYSSWSRELLTYIPCLLPTEL